MQTLLAHIQWTRHLNAHARDDHARDLNGICVVLHLARANSSMHYARAVSHFIDACVFYLRPSLAERCALRLCEVFRVHTPDI